MTIIPAVLVLISGSQIISSSTARWLSSPVDEVLHSASSIAQQYVNEHRDAVSDRARRLAASLPADAIAAADDATLSPLLSAELATFPRGKIECYRAVAGAGPPDVVLSPARRFGPAAASPVQASADRLALQAVTSGAEATNLDQLSSGGWLARSAFPIRNGAQTVGAVVVSESIDPAMETKLRRAASEYENYKAIKVMKGWVKGVYLALFLMVTLLILVSATWFGLYLAKRITRPVQMLAEGAKAIGEGKLDLRLEPETGDELGSLVESFNMMAAELRTSQEKLEQSRLDLQHKNVEVEGRRRYIETVLERVATGVISLGPKGEIETVNGAAARLLGLDASVLGRPAPEVFAREDLRPLLPLVEAARRREPGVVQEITLAREDREIHLAAAATTLTGDAGEARRRGPRARRRDAAHPRAARRRLARRGAPAGARDQEPADAHSAERRAPAPQFRDRAAQREGARRRVHRRDRHRSRGAEDARRRVRAVRAAARAAHRADRSQPAGRGHAAALRRRAAAGHAARRVPAGAGPAAGAHRHRADSAGHHQPRRQRDGGAGRASAPARPDGRPP